MRAENRLGSILVFGVRRAITSIFINSVQHSNLKYDSEFKV
jgi:hypothetical protein